ncbi:hypothetical protein M0R45_030091 [Rubus argutus]|uniref:Uncharacterized protein n=1 Tax=Rubus argutus TaxID=59490 RepID=A0AAW1WE82_RUBAR
MWFMSPVLINKIYRSHSKKSYEQLVNEHVEISSKKKKKHGSTPKGCKVLLVGAEEKKYSVPNKDFSHPKLQELLEKYQGPVFDPKCNEPTVLDQCSIEAFELLLNNNNIRSYLKFNFSSG